MLSRKHYTDRLSKRINSGNKASAGLEGELLYKKNKRLNKLIPGLLKRQYKLFVPVILFAAFLYFNGCTDLFLNPSGSNSSAGSKLSVKIISPVSSDTIAYAGTNISYNLTTDAGINFIELYINGVIHRWNPVNSDGTKPVIPITLDSTYINSRITYFLIYYDKDGLSARSDTIKNVLITGVPPITPYYFSFIRINSDVLNLSWKDSTYTGQTGYEIWRKRGYYGGYELKLVAPPGTYNINDENAEDTTVYYYKIRSLNKFGTSNFSYELNTYGEGAAHSIAPPTDLEAQAVSPQKIILTWNDDVTGENYFKIERRYTWANYTTAGTTNRNTTQFVDSANGLTPSTGYYYRVKAVSGSDSSWSNEVYIVTPSQ